MNSLERSVNFALIVEGSGQFEQKIIKVWPVVLQGL